MGDTLDIEGAIQLARMYLADAANTELSPHGRFGAVMNALDALCQAGIGDEHDRLLTDFWEASRYKVDAWPTRHQVAVVHRHVVKLLHGWATAEVLARRTDR